MIASHFPCCYFTTGENSRGNHGVKKESTREQKNNNNKKEEKARRHWACCELVLSFFTIPHEGKELYVPDTFLVTGFVWLCVCTICSGVHNAVACLWTLDGWKIVRHVIRSEGLTWELCAVRKISISSLISPGRWLRWQGRRNECISKKCSDKNVY